MRLDFAPIGTCIRMRYLYHFYLNNWKWYYVYGFIFFILLSSRLQVMPKTDKMAHIVLQATPKQRGETLCRK